MCCPTKIIFKFTYLFSKFTTAVSEHFADYTDMSDKEFIIHYKQSIQDVIDAYDTIPEKETAYNLFHLFNCLTEYGHRELIHADEFFEQINTEIQEKDRN